MAVNALSNGGAYWEGLREGAPWGSVSPLFGPASEECRVLGCCCFGSSSDWVGRNIWGDGGGKESRLWGLSGGGEEQLNYNSQKPGRQAQVEGYWEL